jgi:hypothetical protein
MLLGLNLPNFSIENWRSTIRKHVNAHPTYKDITKPINLGTKNGVEEADLVYKDVDGILTSLFIKNGYLKADIWTDCRPTYYIEVKSTASYRFTPFYMSDSQYKRV